MSTHTYSKEAHLKANERYLKKTYKQIPIRLKKDEDKDILDSIQEARARGISMRQWLRDLYETKKQSI